MRMTFTALSVLALLAAGCDPEAPVESSDVEAEIDAKIAVHAANSTTHSNLLVPAANVSGEFDGDQIEDGSIGIADLGIGSVGAEELADQSISVADMGAGSVGSLQLVDQAVTTAKIAPNAVTATEIAVGAIAGGVGGVLLDDSIDSADINNNSILGVDIANNTLSGTQIANDILDDGDIVDDGLDDTSLAANSVTASELANNAVDTNAIVDGDVTTAKIANQGVTQAKIDSDWSGQRVDATGGAGANYTVVFGVNNNTGAMVTVDATGACDSDQANGRVRINNGAQDDVFICPDTNLTTPDLFALTLMVADGDTLTFEFDAGMNNATMRWRLFKIEFN